jgi:orotate phosphoribosyltransferase
MSRKEEIAEALLSIQAVFLRPKDPFTWASGIHSPIYCDNRLTLSFPEVRRKIEKGLAELVREHFPEASALFGTSTAGIAHAALAAEILDLPMGYVRGSAKDHGRQNQIEGALSEGQPVVVVEDLISTGGSVIECVEVLRENGAKVLGVVSIFTYGMEKGKKRLKEADVENYSLCDLDSLLPVAAGKGYIEEKEVAKLLRFRDNPSDESWMKE